jgi:transcriptional regulator with XRE-family HTH domain
MTREQLAVAAGMKVGGIRDLEQGKRHPVWDTVLAICQALHVMPNDFTSEPQPHEVKRGRPRKVGVKATPESPEQPNRKGKAGSR